MFPPPPKASLLPKAPPFEVPTQDVVADWKPLAGQAPDDPVQLSATSHWPAEGRHVVVADWKPSTELPAAAQGTGAAHAAPRVVPTQVVVAAWKPSAGQAPDDPVQLSATSD